ncbi:MAG TPA: hypothetical protein HA252_05080 [Candidatus Diapherotrites archaeon]|uniref:Uncharacterized protein n=1 Tax=Candidatus Iainarchaeum sp. TaxID=3101447 RepID=A0A7J4JG67_9ARCH|nr:hypothetical protein [Candidatus Diapherotrites archaeon]HIH16753.1 hypothetical protein [Candidatus Diapherotrites archaeon]
MLGFTLSKLNLLIFVTAIFAIVAFFSFVLVKIVTTNELNLLLDRVKVKSEALVNSPTYCDSTFYYFPAELRVSGDTFFYTVKISQQATEVNGKNLNYLIFSAFARRDKEFKNSLAANSLKTDADVVIFSSEPLLRILGDEEGAVIDPQARPPINAIAMVKEIVGGKATLYIVPCLAEANQCLVRLEQAGCYAKANRDLTCDNGDKKGFLCLPG